MKLSKSKIFAYDFCPLSFKLVYIDGIEKEETPEMIVGNRIHEFFDKFFKHYQEKPWVDLVPEDFSDQELEMVDFFFDVEYKRLFEEVEVFEPMATELFIENSEYRGYIDRIDDLGNDNVRLVEYKTGKSHNISKLKQEMHFYKMLFEQEYPEYNVTEFRVYNPNLKILEDFGVNSRSMTYLMKKIDTLKNAIETNEFPVKCNFNKWFACGLCDLQDISDEMF